jgi:hypothetical protein
MWYFAAKADLAYLERFKKTLTNYLSVRDRVEEMEPRYRTLAARGLLQSDESTLRSRAERSTLRRGAVPRSSILLCVITAMYYNKLRWMFIQLF